MVSLSASRAEAASLLKQEGVPSAGLSAARQAEARAAGDEVALALWSRLRWREIVAADPGASSRGFTGVRGRCVPFVAEKTPRRTGS